MINIEIENLNDNIVISWQLANMKIPVSDIIDLRLNDTYEKEEQGAIRIGNRQKEADRLVIKTISYTYIIFSPNGRLMKEKINSFLKQKKI